MDTSNYIMEMKNKGVLFMTQERTSCESAILAYISYYMASYGYSPTYREIGSAVGIRSSSTVCSHLRALRDQGFIAFDARKARGISISDRMIE